VSLRGQFGLNWSRVLAERQRNMRRYDFPYNETGVDKRTGLSIEEFHDVYDGKWLVNNNKLNYILDRNSFQISSGNYAAHVLRLRPMSSRTLELGLF